MSVQAVLLAGDRGASRAVMGESKAFLRVGGRPMVVHVLEALLHSPEVSEVFVVGDAIRLEKTLSEFGGLQLAAVRSKPVHIVPQRETLYENTWHTFLRTMPPGGRDDGHAVLVVPSDIPLVVPEEISDFVRQSVALDVDYVVGLTPESALQAYAAHEGSPGVEMASFHLAEGRFRQNNLHFVRPLRMGNRHYIQDLYEHRYQKEFGNMIRLGWRILCREFRHLWVLFYYALMHLALTLDRLGYGRGADRVRARVSLRTVERGIGELLRTRLTTVVTGLGGAALDVDNETDLHTLDKMVDRWKAMQTRLAQAAILEEDD